jgi:OOP family OmpA-OmpF porin
VKASKKGRQAIFIIQPVSLSPLDNASLFWHREIPQGFFQRAEKATAIRNNIQGGRAMKTEYKGVPKMKAMYRAALMAAAFVFLLPLSARSEIKAGSLELTPFAGYNLFENNQNLKNQYVFGGRIGYNFTRYFGIELSGESIHTSVDDRARTASTPGQFGHPIDKVHITFYNIDAVYNFMPDGNFNPYVSVGVGGTRYRPSISTKDMTNIDFGSGVKLWASDNIALRVDLRDHMVTEILQETYHNIEATIGITFAFGGEKKAPIRVQAQEFMAKPVPKAEEPVVILVSEPKVEEKVKVAAAEPKIIVLAFEDVHFDFDKSTLTPEAQAILKRNIQMLKDNPNAKVRIAGYTSASGTEDYNQKLSERRAKAVQEYLINEGIITPDRLSTIGYGESYPAAYEAAPKEIYSNAAKANMRVLFEIIVK